MTNNNNNSNNNNWPQFPNFSISSSEDNTRYISHKGAMRFNYTIQNPQVKFYIRVKNSITVLFMVYVSRDEESLTHCHSNP